MDKFKYLKKLEECYNKENCDFIVYLDEIKQLTKQLLNNVIISDTYFKKEFHSVTFKKKDFIINIEFHKKFIEIRFFYNSYLLFYNVQYLKILLKSVFLGDYKIIKYMNKDDNIVYFETKWNNKNLIEYNRKEKLLLFKNKYEKSIIEKGRVMIHTGNGTN